MCGKLMVISAINIKKVATSSPTDNKMGINGIKLKCVFKDWSEANEKTLEYDTEGEWNTWKTDI